MTFFGMALLTAIGTIVLAVFAIFTAVYARKAFREQSREVAAIEQQVKDEQEVTRQQAELLKVQSGQLDLQRQQVEDQLSAVYLSAHTTMLNGSAPCQVDCHGAWLTRLAWLQPIRSERRLGRKMVGDPGGRAAHRSPGSAWRSCWALPAVWAFRLGVDEGAVYKTVPIWSSWLAS